jgi:hypothetical protein
LQDLEGQAGTIHCRMRTPIRFTFSSKLDQKRNHQKISPSSQNGLPRGPQMEPEIIKICKNVVLDRPPTAGTKNNTQKVRFGSLRGRVEWS